MAFEEKSAWVMMVVSVSRTRSTWRSSWAGPDGRRSPTSPTRDRCCGRSAPRSSRRSWLHIVIGHRAPGEARRARTSATGRSTGSASTSASRSSSSARVAALLMAMAEWDHVLDRQRRSTCASCCRRSLGSRRQDRRLPPGLPAVVKPTRVTNTHPRAAVRARRDDPGRAGRAHRRDPPDRHRHRAGPLLAVAGDGVPDRPGVRRPARRRLPVPRRPKETRHEGDRPGRVRLGRRARAQRHRPARRSATARCSSRCARPASTPACGTS